MHRMLATKTWPTKLMTLLLHRLATLLEVVLAELIEAVKEDGKAEALVPG
jgi:hypothetical protein